MYCRARERSGGESSTSRRSPIANTKSQKRFRFVCVVLLCCFVACCFPLSCDGILCVVSTNEPHTILRVTVINQDAASSQLQGELADNRTAEIFLLKMYAATHTTRDENFLSMRIIESSGSSSTVGKSSRALLGYVRTAALEPASCIYEKATIASQNSLREVSHDMTNDNDTTAVRMMQDLSFRDLRVLDHHFDGDDIHSIIVRKGCILITSDPFRAVIMADRLIVILPSNVKACDNMNDILAMFESCFTGEQLQFLVTPSVPLSRCFCSLR